MGKIDTFENEGWMDDIEKLADPSLVGTKQDFSFHLENGRSIEPP